MSLIDRTSGFTGGAGATYNTDANSLLITMVPSTIWAGYTVVLSSNGNTRTFYALDDIGPTPGAIVVWLDPNDAFTTSFASGTNQLTITATDGPSDTVSNVQPGGLQSYNTLNPLMLRVLSNTETEILTNIAPGITAFNGGSVIEMSGYLIDSTGMLQSSLPSAQTSIFVFYVSPPFTGNSQFTSLLSDNSKVVNLRPVVIPKYLQVTPVDNGDNSVSVSFSWFDGQGGITASSFTVSDSNGGTYTNFVSGSVYPVNFIGGIPVTFTVSARDIMDAEIGSNSAEIILGNATITFELTSSAPTEDFSANVSVTLSGDNSNNQFLTSQIRKTEINFEDDTFTTRDITLPATSFVTTGLTRAGSINVNITVYFNDLNAPPMTVPVGSVNVSGINASSNGAIGSAMVYYDYYDEFGIHGTFGNVLASVTHSNAQIYTATSNNPNGALVVSGLPVGPYTVTVSARGTDNTILSSIEKTSLQDVFEGLLISNVTPIATNQTVNVLWENPDITGYAPLYYDSITEIVLVLTDTLGGSQIATSIGDIVNNSTSASLTGVPLGSYTVQVVSKLYFNPAGSNINDFQLVSSGTDTVVVDTADPPVLTITSVTSPSDGLINVNFDATNSVAQYYIITFTGILSVISSGELSSTQPYEAQLPADSYTVTVSAFNTNDQEIAISGSSQPVTVSDSGGGGGGQQNTLSVSATASGVISWIFTGPAQVNSYSVDITNSSNVTATHTTSGLSYTASGLSDGAYSVTVSALTDLGDVLCTGGSSFTVSSGNNGGTGHNPMSTGSALYFEKPDYSASATQEVDITLIGQTQIAPDADQTIVVSTALAYMNDSLEIEAVAGWNLSRLEGPDSAQKYPNVTFKPATLVSGMVRDANSETVEDRFLHSNSGTGSDPAFADDAATSGLLSLQDYMNEIVDSNFNASDFQKIPLEAVKSVDRKELECTRLSVVLGEPVPSLSTETSGDEDWALRLFEQAAAAGKIVDADATGRTVAGPSFAAGDSISVYVKYTLNKTRKYLLDGDAAPRAAFKVGDLVIDPSDGDEEETSNDVDKVIEWKFVAVAA